MAVPQQGFQLQPGGCIVGTEGGTVLRCNIDANAAAHKAFAQVGFCCLLGIIVTSCCKDTWCKDIVNVETEQLGT